ncbi:MAG: peptidoglycan-binding protein [Euzebya sp.]
MDRFFPTICVVVTMLVVMSLIPAAYASSDRNATIDLSFPVAGAYTYRDNYNENRGGGVRRHQATDIFGVKGQPIHAAVGGRICFSPGIEEPMPGFGYILRICTGNVVYSYIHLNNDTPGTDDGQGGYRRAYAPGIRDGVTVSRGQLIGFMGDSGNAEDTPPHLHFDIFDADLVDSAIANSPWRQHYRNPYPSLRAAENRGSVVSGAMRLGHSGAEVSAWQQDLNAGLDAGLTVDGAFGPSTDAATRRLQDSAGLTVDGVVGPATRAAMDTRLQQTGEQPASQPTQAATGVSFPGRVLRLEAPLMRGDDVRAWQERMRDRGWRGEDGRPLEVDGWFGQDSWRAVRLFQEEKGLRIDGVVGRVTWDAAFAS